jgi:hypothetical protein
VLGRLDPRVAAALRLIDVSPNGAPTFSAADPLAPASRKQLLFAESIV